ncbi:MAG: ABC transporter permease [Candidatus Methanoplasma sp.]|jgi:ABC-2 type transport system permease protein|nr:ABC transporter permease [Candidatus Methanoplasma sp.]
MMYIETDDIRQISVIAKNEIRKSLRGRKFLAYAVIIAMIFLLITFLPLALMDDPWNSMTSFLVAHFSFATILVILAATIFASSTYVSEFEERTALILFTRPVKRTTIYLGKFMGCFIMEAVVFIGYYVAVCSASLFLNDSPSAGQYLASLGGILLCLLAASALAAVFSVIMRKAGMAAIMTFVTMLILLSIVSGAISIATHEMPWYMLDQAMNVAFVFIPDVAKNLGLGDFDQMKGILTLAVWGAASMFMSWLLFTRKEMQS